MSDSDAIDIRVLVQEKAARLIAGGLSKSSWYRLERGINPSAGVFPKSYRLPGLSARKFYKVADVKVWIRSQLEAAE